MDFTFNDLHQKEVGDDVSKFGLPDDGNGRYMRAKPYPDWYFMNVARRQISNNTESIVTVLPCSLINGAVYPYVTMGLLSTYLVGRYFYVEGYVQKEGVRNNMRMAGAVMSHSATWMTTLLTLGIGIALRRG